VRRLAPREIVIVAVAVVAGVVLPLYRFVFAPELAALGTLNTRIETQTREAVRREAAADRLPAVRDEHTALARRVQEMERQMPASISVSTLMGRISQAIAVSGVQLIEVTFPAGTQPSVSPTGRHLREGLTPMDPTRSRNLIWLAVTGSASPWGGGANLAAAWDVAVAQMAAARRAGNRADAARWEAKANALYVQITGHHPDE